MRGYRHLIATEDNASNSLPLAPAKLHGLPRARNTPPHTSHAHAEAGYSAVAAQTHCTAAEFTLISVAHVIMSSRDTAVLKRFIHIFRCCYMSGEHVRFIAAAFGEGYFIVSVFIDDKQGL